MSTAPIRVHNHEKDTKIIQYKLGPAPKKGDKDEREVRTLTLGSSADRGKNTSNPPPTVEVDEETYRALCTDPRFRAPPQLRAKGVQGWLDTGQISADRGAATV